MLASLLALLSGLALPFAPVRLSEPVITWPLDPSAPEPTMLMLTSYQPAKIEVRFSCRAARAAAEAPDGLVLATMAENAREAQARALVVRVAPSGELTVRSRGKELVRAPLPPGRCRYLIAGDRLAVSVFLNGTPVGEVRQRPAAPDPERSPFDDRELLAESALPDVDLLTTSVRALPDPDDDLVVRIVADDFFNTVPTTGKLVLTTVAAVSIVAALGAVALRDRMRSAFVGKRRSSPGVVRTRLTRHRPRPVDVGVVAVLVAWLFLSPMTDDDGYYSAMAANVPFSGYVPNYYQLYNQGFTPFSWVYYALSAFQQQFGRAPVVQQLPALLLGVGTWMLARAFVARAGMHADPRPARTGRELKRDGLVLRGVLALAFLAWWLPYGMGVRPEPVVAFAAVASLASIAYGIERSRLAPVAVGWALAGAGLMAAPTGFVALAAPIVTAPAVHRMIRARSATGRTIAAEWIVVTGPIALAAVLGFADGSWRDFVRSQEIFAPIQTAMTWYLEIARYASLLDPYSHFGSYARRAAVLVCLVALVWFVTVQAARPNRHVWLGRSGWVVVASLVLLLPTPSKPSHHFGALAGIGPVFLALFLVAAPRLVREIAQRRPVPVAVLAVAAGSVVATCALVGHGPNSWPYSWNLGMAAPDQPPAPGGLPLDHPMVWAGAFVAAWVGLRLVCARVAGNDLAVTTAAAASVTVCLLFATTTVHLLGSFGYAAQQTSATYSPQSDAWQDPGGTRCGAAAQVDVLDPGSARVLVPAGPGPASVTGATPFVLGGWRPGRPPPDDLPAAVPVWGSAVDRDDRVATGRFASPWYQLAQPPQGHALVTVVSGLTGDGNEFRVQFGRESRSGAVQVVADLLQEVAVDSSVWRSHAIDVDSAPPEADRIRLAAVDTSTAEHGWMAFGAPTVQRWIPLHEYLRDRQPTGVAWQTAFLFPCLEQPRQRDGVTEPAGAALTWGAEPLSGLRDWAFDPDRGGLMGPALREAAVTRLSLRFRDFPAVDKIEAYVFQYPLSVGRYQLSTARVAVSGAAGSGV